MLTYEDSGVSVKKNDELVDMISTNTGVSTGFADCQSIPGTNQYIVQCSDGVGTKIQLAQFMPSLYTTIGQDLVAMCANDLICAGARPAFFQDYIGMNRLDSGVVRHVIKSINDACEMSGMTLTGGEMAEMPGTYKTEVPELVGFATGFTYKDHIIDKNNVKAGMHIIALPSSGPHSNGYSLIRQVLGNVVNDQLLREVCSPTEIYHRVATLYMDKPAYITSMAHITGGGLDNNLARAIPKHLEANVNYNRWQVPNVFNAIQQFGDVDPDSMWSTFNMGVGMCLIVEHIYVGRVMDYLSDFYSPLVIGEVVNK